MACGPVGSDIGTGYLFRQIILLILPKTQEKVFVRRRWCWGEISVFGGVKQIRFRICLSKEVRVSLVR